MGNTLVNPRIVLSNNDKQGICFAKVLTKYQKGQRIIEIGVMLGCNVFPQLQNRAITEQTKTDIAMPQCLRRFVRGDLSMIKDNMFNMEIIIPNHYEKYQNKELGGVYLLRLPLAIQTLEIVQDEIYDNHNENEHHKQIIHARNSELYRQQYQEQYAQIFTQIHNEDLTVKTVGILDLPMNNLILGINNYEMVHDILDAFFKNQHTLVIDSIQFVTENYQQASIFALAVWDYFCEPQIEEQQMILQPTQIFRKQGKQIIFHEQFITFKYFRPTKEINSQIMDFLPIIDQQNKQCLCGRQLVYKSQHEFCCYCRIQRRAFWVCEERACDRAYCSSCIIPHLNRYKCIKNHDLQYKEDLDQPYICDVCNERSENMSLGKWRCQECDYDICGRCYFSLYASTAYKRIPTYYRILKQQKPNLKDEIIRELIFEHLITIDYKMLTTTHVIHENLQ